MKTLPPPDIQMVNRYLDILTGSHNEAVTFQFFDDRDKKNRKVASHRQMKRSLTYTFLQSKQKQGCGVFVMVNKGNGNGRSKKHIVGVRALFVDLDGSPYEPAAGMLSPHIRVESSRGRWHLYWKVSNCSLEQFKPLQQAIAKKFDGDKSCCDLSRVLRVPGFYHLKTDTPFLTRLVEPNDFPAYTTQQIIDGLGLVSDEKIPQLKPPAPANKGFECIAPHTGEVFNISAWAAKNPDFDIVAVLDPQYAIGEIKDGKQHIECPFKHEHTDTGSDLSTFIANANPPQYTGFVIKCMHSHCTGRDRLEFLSAMLKTGRLSADILQTPAALQMKKPPKIYFTVNDIALALEWSALTADEYRIALHFMALAWAEDGTLPDNDWMLARRLRLQEDQWIAYRETLTRTGWLIEENGRLTNSIVKREYVKAQTAYMSFCKSGGKGGKITQQKRQI